METWRINKDGKADMLLQYDRAKRKMIKYSIWLIQPRHGGALFS
jgi:hypothetical protein